MKADMKKRIKFVETYIPHYHLCYNQNKEMLGKLFIHPRWKKWVWEQNKGIIMSRNSLTEVVKFMESLGGRE